MKISVNFTTSRPTKIERRFLKCKGNQKISGIKFQLNFEGNCDTTGQSNQNNYINYNYIACVYLLIAILFVTIDNMFIKIDVHRIFSILKFN